MVSVRSTPGTSGWPGKCPSKTGLASGPRPSASIRPAARSRGTTRSIISKYSRRMERVGARGNRQRRGVRPWRPSRPPERVDPRAEVLQHEVLLGRDLALVDLLGPSLQRQLDAEGLVDREGDVEEGERIDAEVVDRVALGRDLVARDVGGVRDDVGDGLEGGRHLSRSVSGQEKDPSGRGLGGPPMGMGFRRPSTRRVCEGQPEAGLVSVSRHAWVGAPLPSFRGRERSPEPMNTVCKIERNGVRSSKRSCSWVPGSALRGRPGMTGRFTTLQPSSAPFPHRASVRRRWRPPRGPRPPRSARPPAPR